MINSVLLTFLNTEYLSNRILDYLIALGIILGGILGIKILRRFILKSLKKWTKKTVSGLDDSLIRIFEQTFIPAFYLGSFYLAISNLSLHPIFKETFNVFGVIIATIIGIRFFISLAEYFLRVYVVSRESKNDDLAQSIHSFIPAIRTIIWAIGLVFILDNLGFDVSSVIATLGIGGVAIALASQGVLQDLFSYFSILFDRPFELGDFIIVSDFVGTVEHVGIKTTRLTSLDGEAIVIANSDLINSRIRNYKRMKKRRIVFKIGVTYQTDVNQLKSIPIIIQNIVENTNNTTFDRTHFSTYNEFSLDFEIVYYVTTNDYNKYMDAQQEINLKIKQEFDRHNIKFAYPTQVNYLNSSSLAKSLN